MFFALIVIYLARLLKANEGAREGRKVSTACPDSGGAAVSSASGYCAYFLCISFTFSYFPFIIFIIRLHFN
jgi:hypothetical protein